MDFEHGCFDGRALPRAVAVRDAGKDGERKMQARDLVADDGGKIPRPSLCVGIERGEARDALDDVIVCGRIGAGAFAAEARGKRIDEARIFGAQRFVGEPEFRRRLGAHVVHDDVGILREAADDGLAFGIFQVDGDGAFVAVDAHEGRAHGGGAAGTRGAIEIALGRLDLDHVGAEIAQDLGGIGAEHDRGEIDDLEAFEKVIHRGLPSLSPWGRGWQARSARRVRGQ